MVLPKVYQTAVESREQTRVLLSPLSGDLAATQVKVIVCQTLEVYQTAVESREQTMVLPEVYQTAVESWEQTRVLPSPLSRDLAATQVKVMIFKIICGGSFFVKQAKLFCFWGYAVRQTPDVWGLPNINERLCRLTL